MRFDLCEVIGNQDKLKEKFNIIRHFGGGGESCVFLVEEIETKNRFALVVETAVHRIKKPDADKPVITAMLDSA